MKKFSIRALLVLIIVLVAIRFMGLTQNPAGLYLDEASIALNATLIAEEGVDEYGRTLPVYFEAFGEYKNPLYIYSQAFIFKLFGSSILTSRLTSALWGLFAILSLGYFSWTISKSRLSLLVVLILGLTNPWLFLQSRVVFEVISSVSLTILAVTLFYKYIKKQNNSAIYLMVVCLGLLFYSYTAFRLIAPVFLLVSTLFYLDRLKFKVVFLWMLFGIFLLPALMWEQVYPGTLMFAYHRVSQEGLLTFSGFRQFVFDYLIHFSYRFLVSFGDGFPRHTFFNRSILLVSSIPFVLLGLYGLIRKEKSKRFVFFLLSILLIGIIPSAITSQSPHALRAVVYLTGLLLLAAYGASWMVARKDLRAFVALFTILMILEFGAVYHYFSTQYPTFATKWFDADEVATFKLALERGTPPFFVYDVFPEEYGTTWEYLAYISNQDNPGELQHKPLVIDGLEFGTYISTREWCGQNQQALILSQAEISHVYDYCVVFFE